MGNQSSSHGTLDTLSTIDYRGGSNTDPRHVDPIHLRIDPNRRVERKPSKTSSLSLLRPVALLKEARNQFNTLDTARKRRTKALRQDSESSRRLEDITYISSKDGQSKVKKASETEVKQKAPDVNDSLNGGQCKKQKAPEIVVKSRNATAKRVKLPLEEKKDYCGNGKSAFIEEKKEKIEGASSSEDSSCAPTSALICGESRERLISSDREENELLNIVESEFKSEYSCTDNEMKGNSEKYTCNSVEKTTKSDGIRKSDKEVAPQTVDNIIVKNFISENTVPVEDKQKVYTVNSSNHDHQKNYLCVLPSTKDSIAPNTVPCRIDSSYPQQQELQQQQQTHHQEELKLKFEQQQLIKKESNPEDQELPHGVVREKYQRHLRRKHLRQKLRKRRHQPTKKDEHGKLPTDQQKSPQLNQTKRLTSQKPSEALVTEPPSPETSLSRKRTGVRKKSFRRSAFSRYRRMLKDGTLTQDMGGRLGGPAGCLEGESWGGSRSSAPSSRTPRAGSAGTAIPHPEEGTRGSPQSGRVSSSTTSLPSAGGRAAREELHLVREAIGALRTNFRSTDPNQHILDTLEQAIAILMEKNSSSGSGGTGAGGGDPASFDPLGSAGETRLTSSDPQTKVIYFTERTVTPFMSTIAKALGDVRLRDFKVMFDRPGLHRYHFKNYDPEYGMVKEEILNDEDILPGVDGKIIAWVEEDHE